MQRILNTISQLGLSLFLLLFSIGANCETESHVKKSPDVGKHFLKVDPTQITLSGNCLIYIPAYSHIHLSQNITTPLAVTLSLRNTDMNNAIYIKNVDYYNTQGKLLESLAAGLFALKPLATVSFIIEQEDLRGGIGANFIVEWASEKTVSFPIFEAVMAGYSGTKGLGFLSRGEKLQCDY